MQENQRRRRQWWWWWWWWLQRLSWISFQRNNEKILRKGMKHTERTERTKKNMKTGEVFFIHSYHSFIIWNQKKKLLLKYTNWKTHTHIYWRHKDTILIYLLILNKYYHHSFLHFEIFLINEDEYGGTIEEKFTSSKI